MDPLELLIDLVTKLKNHGLRYFVTGSHATITYGEPRFTDRPFWAKPKGRGGCSYVKVCGYQIS